jgi:hypothetical protein
VDTGCRASDDHRTTQDERHREVVAEPAELRRLIKMLRDAEDTRATLAPPPGLAEVHGLVAEVVATGVDVHRQGDLADVPDGVSRQRTGRPGHASATLQASRPGQPFRRRPRGPLGG